MRPIYWLRFLARPALAILAGAGRVRSRGFSRSSSVFSELAYGSEEEARLAVCRRMSTACLLRRVARGTWSRTSHAAATTILDRRHDELVALENRIQAERNRIGVTVPRTPCHVYAAQEA